MSVMLEENVFNNVLDVFVMLIEAMTSAQDVISVKHGKEDHVVFVVGDDEYSTFVEIVVRITAN